MESPKKVLGSKRLGRAFSKWTGSKEDEDDEKMAMGFNHLLNELKGLVGSVSDAAPSEER